MSAGLVWVALRELWMSFRFLVLLVLGLAGGLAVSVAQPGFGDLVAVLAWGIAAGGTAGAALAAGVLAAERRRGRVAWLAVRGVPRSAALFAWFAALAVPLLAGLAASAGVGWVIATQSGSGLIDPLAFAAAAGAAAVGVLAALAAALLAGALLEPRPAAILAGTVAAGLMVSGLAAASEPPLGPAAGIGLLAQLPSLARPLSDGLEAMGVGLAATALLLAAAAAVLARRDL